MSAAVERLLFWGKKSYDENNFWIQCWLNTSVLYPPAHYVLQPLSVSEMWAKNSCYLNLTTIKCCVNNPNGERQEHKSSQLSKANKKCKVEFMFCLFFLKQQEVLILITVNKDSCSLHDVTHEFHMSSFKIQSELSPCFQYLMCQTPG